MKTIIKLFKIVIIVVEVLLLVICSSDLINFLQHPENYPIGSEVVDKAGWAYSSNFTFIFFNSIMIVFSILLSFLALGSKKIKFLLLILLFVICQVGCSILL